MDHLNVVKIEKFTASQSTHWPHSYNDDWKLCTGDTCSRQSEITQNRM